MWSGAGLVLPAAAPLSRIELTVDAAADDLFPFFNDRQQHRRMRRDGWERGGSVPPMTLASLGGPDAGVGTRICFCLDGEGLTPVTRPLRGSASTTGSSSPS